MWTDNKARFIARYLYYFVLITKHGTYIHVLAGRQNLKKRDMWTAKLVLENEPHWLRHFHLFDVRKDKVEVLRDLKASQPPRKKGEAARSIAGRAMTENRPYVIYAPSESIRAQAG